MKILILSLAFLALVASTPQRAVKTSYSFHFMVFGNEIQNTNSASPLIGLHKEVLTDLPPGNNEIQNSNSASPPIGIHKQEEVTKQAPRGSCNCRKILVSSHGEAQHFQKNSMGVYKYFKMYNGLPSYSGPSRRMLYFLNGSGWLIGPALGNPTGFIHNANNYPCPYLIHNGWMYYNQGRGNWYLDNTLVVRCIS